MNGHQHLKVDRRPRTSAAYGASAQLAMREPFPHGLLSVLTTVSEAVGVGSISESDF